MSSYKIVNYKTFDLKTLKYANPEKTRGGAFFIKVDTDYELLFYPKEPFVLNTGFTLSEKGTHININLKDTEFGAFIRSLDDYNIDCIHQNCKKWFGNDLPLNVIKQFYVSNMDENYNLKLQIPMSKKTIDIKVFDDKKNVIEHTNLIEGIQIIIVVRYLGIKFLKHEAVMDLDAVQIMVHKPKPVEVISPQPIAHAQVGETIFKRMQQKELLIEKTEQVRLAFQEAERAQLAYQELQKKAMELSRELHDIQAEYDADGDGCDDNYGDEDDQDDQDDDQDDQNDQDDDQDDQDDDQEDVYPKEIDLIASSDNP